MTFWTDIRNAQNESIPNEIRYMSLRHAISHHAPLGFNSTWSLLADRFGLVAGEKNSGSAISNAANFLAQDRMAWLEYEKARVKFVRHRVRAGLPKF